MKVLIVPDAQLRPGVPTKHISALGNWIEDQRPDAVVVMGDWWDMKSCSNYNTELASEGLRVAEDLSYGRAAMDLLWRATDKRNAKHARWKMAQYKPRRIFLMGNHEMQLARLWERDPRLEGLIGLQDFGLESRFEVIPFREVCTLQGIKLSHYFYNPKSSRPIGGQIENKIKWVGGSFIQGHDQHFAYGEFTTAGGEIFTGMVCGSFYLHDEEYKGPTGNNHWRGVCILHDCENGRYDLEKMSADRLCNGWL